MFSRKIAFRHANDMTFPNARTILVRFASTSTTSSLNMNAFNKALFPFLCNRRHRPPILSTISFPGTKKASRDSGNSSWVYHSGRGYQTQIESSKLRSNPTYSIYGERTILQLRCSLPTYRVTQTNNVYVEGSNKGRFLLEFIPRPLVKGE